MFFDNLKVQVVTGNIIEENHYYSYGLKIAAISSKKLGNTYEGTLKNSYLYNDKELFEDGDLNWYDYGFRNYDPQIGRFTQLDPLTDDYPFYTPYQFAGCEPIANVDVDGLEPANVLAAPGKMLEGVVIKSIIPKIATGTASVGAKALTVGKVGLQLANTANNIVSESTNLGLNSSQTALYAPPPPKETPTFSQGSKSLGPAKPKTDDYYLNKIKKERLEKLSNRPGDVFPLIGNLVKSGRMEINGFHDEAGSALKDAGVEAALMYGGNAGIKYLFAARTGKNIVGTTYNKVLPTQDWINPAKVSEYKLLLKSRQTLPPINSYRQGGKIFIEDGHHRFAAYMEMGMKPNMIIRNTGGPVGYSNWTNTTFQTPPLGY